MKSNVHHTSTTPSPGRQCHGRTDAQPVSSPGRRRFLRHGAALGGAAATSSFIGVEALAAGKTGVNMQLGWLASNGIMGEVVAKRMGYYEEEGIEFEVTPGGPGVASELEAVGTVLGFSFDGTTAQDGWAAMNPANWQAQIDTYVGLGQFKGPTPSLADVMTTDVLAATEPLRKRIG